MSSIYARIELGQDGKISGQIFSAEAPHVVRTLEILLDDQVCATTICDLPGVNGGKNGFEIALQLGQMHFSESSRIGFRDKLTGEKIDRLRPVPDAWRALRLKDPAIVGYVENVTDDGRVIGWAWAPAAPLERLVITVMIDDQPVLTSVASFDRADLRDAGIGDGKYGFDCTLPWELIANQRQIRVSVRATPMLNPFGKCFLLRRDQGGKLEERLIAAEAELKRVKAEFTAAQQALQHAGLAASSQLFATVGAFFTELAQTAGKGEMPVLASKRGASLADLAARFPRLALAPPPANPEARIMVPAVGSIDTVVGCLEAIRRSGADLRAEIMLFDDGSVQEAALLPALVRHLRYLRLLPGEDAGRLRNDALLGSSAPVVVLVAPVARVEGGWFDLLLQAISPGVAAVGAGLLREDGMFHSTGLLLGGGAGRMIDVGAGHSPGHPSARVRREVDALGFGCVAISRASLSAQAGFDSSIHDWCAALLNFCLAVRQNGARVLIEPAARAHWLELPDQPMWVRRNFGVASPPMPQLRSRWKKTIQAADAAKQGLDRFARAHVLVVGDAPFDLLRDAGCRVSWLTPATYGEEDRLRGVELVVDLDQCSATMVWCADESKLAGIREKFADEKIYAGTDWRELIERMAATEG